jgi:hypothetical protein
LVAGYPQRFLLRDDGSFWIALKKADSLTALPEHLRGLLVAPKGSKWEDGADSMLVDAPLQPK